MQKLSHAFCDRFKKFHSNIPYLYRALFLVWDSARVWTIAWVFLLVCKGILPIITVFLTREIVNSLVMVVKPGADWIQIRHVILVAGFMGLALFLDEVLNASTKWVKSVQSELVTDHVMDIIHDKTTTLDMAHYETPEYYDQLHRARGDAISRPLMLLDNLGTLLRNSITMLAMAGVLASYSIWIIVLLFVGGIPAVVVISKFSIRLRDQRLKNTPNERLVQYYNSMLTQYQYAAESRLFNLGPFYRGAYRKLRMHIRKEHLALQHRQALAELGASLFAQFCAAIAIVWMVWRAMSGLASLGDVALFYQVFNQGQGIAKSLLGSSGEIYRNILFLDNLFEFLKLEPHIKEPENPETVPSPIKEGIIFESVRFCYPSGSQTALNELNLIIPAQNTVALVGDNGAGKSTIVKLLCRFYDPDSGCITLDGTDIRNFNTEEYRRRITVLFQTPVHYHTTAFENIVISENMERFSMDDVESAARNAGAHDFISRLPDGYETVLSKWFGGTELSVGEWQRLALARAFIRKSEIVILDEPTSSMDSWAEADWLDRFKSLVEGRTAIIITHRFTTAMIADTIHVIKSGRVIESGSHESLVALGGLYGKSWQKQMREAKSTCCLTQ